MVMEMFGRAGSGVPNGWAALRMTPSSAAYARAGVSAGGKRSRQ